MKRWLKRLSMGLGLVVGLAVVALAVFTAISVTRQRKTYAIPVERIPIPTDSGAIDRGQHLVNAVSACTSCHGDDMGGGVVLDHPLLGRFVAANLTRLKGTRDQDLIHAIRHGVARDGRSLLFMPSDAFQSLSDAELAATIAYLRTLTPVDRALPPSWVGPLGRVLHVLGFPLLPAERIDHRNAGKAPQAGVTLEYGRHLATVSGCHGCHGPTLSGGNGPGPNLVAAVATWSEADFRRALRQGTRPDGSKLADQMPWKSYAGMTDEELAALWLYVSSL